MIKVDNVKYKTANTTDKFIVRWADGVMYGARTPTALIRLMKLDTWEVEPNIKSYKSSIQYRASVNGHHFAYWDAESFLTGLESTGLIRILVWEGIDISSGVC